MSGGEHGRVPVPKETSASAFMEALTDYVEAAAEAEAFGPGDENYASLRMNAKKRRAELAEHVEALFARLAT